MALIKCHECEHEISKSAKTCPNCGAKNKKRTSGWTWFFLILGVLWFIGFIGAENNTNYSSVSALNNVNTASVATPQLEVQSWNWGNDHGLSLIHI